VKDLPIWARWNGQEVLGIIRGKDGWHTYYLRRHAHGAPLPRLAESLGAAATYLLERIAFLCGKPWRRLGALLRQRA
jgi:hypothetical protein